MIEVPSPTGYVEGQNVTVDYRYAENQFDRLPAFAADLVRRRVAVIVATTEFTALAAKAATTTIPIVFGGGGDPVALGLVASLNRPGGNVTGYTVLNAELAPKRMQLLRQLMPEAGRFGVLVNPAAPVTPSIIADLGLRISEALKLTLADVTRDGLVIRETKFRKTRLVPLHDTAVTGLRRYLARRWPRSEADPVFVDARGLPLRYIAVKETFDRLVGRAGIAPAAKRRPRLHDLRHTFAVRALQGSLLGKIPNGFDIA